jgi:hypothetical protein
MKFIHHVKIATIAIAQRRKINLHIAEIDYREVEE